MSGYLRKTIQISLVLIALFSIVGIVRAQQDVSNSMSSVNLGISPYNPRAGDSVILTLSSDLLDLDSSKIVWYIDGVARKDTSNKSIVIKAKSDGSNTDIRAVIETSDGIVKEATGLISPAGVDLVVEPMSYSMPFYKGKPLLIGEGVVKIVAMPDVIINGTKASSDNLNFKWSKDDYVLGSNSGKGQNSIIVNSAIPIRDITIGVEILDDSGNTIAGTSKIITINDPKILFYEDSLMYGVLYNKAITGNYYLGTREELDVLAKPFSFDFPKDTSSQSSYTWYANGNYVAPNGKANKLILKQTATGVSGTASISLELKNNDKINQYVNNGFNVQFGE